MNTFSDFNIFVLKTTEIILSDLVQLKKIGEDGNAISDKQTTTFQTTIRPGDNYLPQESENISRCTIPIAMVCFSVIDMIGQWINEQMDDDFGNSAQAFISKLSKKDDLKNQNARTKIKDIFRNGIMHSFFAKSGFSVAYPTVDNNSLFVDLHGSGSTLDVKYLLKIVELGLTNLNLELKDKDSPLSKSAYNGYQFWLKNRTI